MYCAQPHIQTKSSVLKVHNCRMVDPSRMNLVTVTRFIQCMSDSLLIFTVSLV